MILHRFHLALHAYFMMLFPYIMFLFLFFIFKKKKFGGENAGNFIFLFLACQILLVFLLDISIHCALIDFA
jgi:hypothetical protein